MATIRFIGDVHGKFDEYHRLISEVEHSVQVGDLGVGFKDVNTGKNFENPSKYLMQYQNAYFIRGNHDNYQECKKYPTFIDDGTTGRVFSKKMMYIGGAKSIDISHRTEGFDWWRDEEINHKKLYEILDTYEEFRPDIVVSHDCPEIFFDAVRKGTHSVPNITRDALTCLFDIHVPELYIFGHHHTSLDRVFEIDGKSVRAICLAELEYIDIEF